MKSIASRLVLAAIVSSLIWMWNGHNGQTVAASQSVPAQNPAADQQRTPPTLTRIYTGSDGQTHARQVALQMTRDPLLGREQSPTVKVTSSYVVRFPAGYEQDWHPAPARRYVVTLSGRGEIELAGGQKIQLEPGQILQAEDVTGKGHITRTLGNADWTALFVQFDQ